MGTIISLLSFLRLQISNQVHMTVATQKQMTSMFEVGSRAGISKGDRAQGGFKEASEGKGGYQRSEAGRGQV